MALCESLMYIVVAVAQTSAFEYVIRLKSHDDLSMIHTISTSHFVISTPSTNQPV